MTWKWTSILVLCLAVTAVGGHAAPADAPCADPVPGDPSPECTWGFLVHRGRVYDLRDLWDPAQRAASEDRFIREFDPPAIWAGTGSRVCEDDTHVGGRLRGP